MTLPPMRSGGVGDLFEQKYSDVGARDMCCMRCSMPFRSLRALRPAPIRDSFR